MRAVRVCRPGGLDVLELCQIEAPSIRADEVLVRVAYAGCNWSDIQKRQGVYPSPIAYPAMLGGEVAGSIVAVGSGTCDLRIGQSVAAVTGPDLLRGFATFVAVPQNLIIPLEDGDDLRSAACLPVAALTAYHLLNSAYHLRRGDRILIHSIAGGVGLCLTQIAREAGAVIYGTVGSAGKEAMPLAMGARRVIARDEENFVEAILQETGGVGVDLVIDSVGGDVLPRSFDVLRTYGRIINIGEAAGESNFPIRETLYRRSTSLAGFELLHADPGSEAWKRGIEQILAMFRQGRLSLPVAAEFPIEEIRACHALLEGRSTIGKTILKVA